MMTNSQLKEVNDWIESALANGRPFDETLIISLRQNYQDIHFSYAMDDDVFSSEPVAERDLYNLYLIDSSQHCLQITHDQQCATGLLLADIDL